MKRPHAEDKGPADKGTAPARYGANAWLLWLPLLLFGVMIALAVYGLRRDPASVHRSALIGKALPAFTLPPAVPTMAGVASHPAGAAAARGTVAPAGPRLINIFASWCGPCAAEAPSLEVLRRAGVRIDGVAVRDRAEDLAVFLATNGNPYAAIGSDPEARVQLSLGSAGVPESFLVDAQGIIRYQHVGPVMPQDLDRVLAEWRALQ